MHSADSARRQCERIFKSFDEQGEKYGCTICMGAAFVPDHGEHYAELFQRADQALYASKRSGRHRFTLYHEDCAGFVSAVTPVEEVEGRGQALSCTPAKDLSADSAYSLLMSALNVSVSKHMLDEHFTLVWANDRYYEMFGYTKAEYETLFHNRCDRFYNQEPEDWQALVRHVTGSFAGGASTYEYVCRMPHRDGRKLWVKLTGTRIDEFVEGSQLAYTVMTDVTEQMQAQVEQSVTYQKFPGLIAKFRVGEDGFYCLDANEKYFEVFPQKDRYLFSEMDEASGLAPVAESRHALRAGSSAAFSIFQNDLRGRRVYMNVNAECVDWIGQDPVYLLLYTDVTRLTQQNAELERLAFTDPVTGGMNRTRFEMVAGATIHANLSGAYTVVWMNMQKFKLINDLAGNVSGDAVLKHVHTVLTRHLRPGELAARTYADSYCLLLESDADAAVAARLSAMVDEINGFNRAMEQPYFLSFTAGACRADDSALEITQLLDRANLARKEIRKMENGQLCACKFYSDVERAELLAEKEIENRMRPALQNHEFVVYLQPKLSLAGHKVEGAEALVRWQDPQKGLIAPDSFIPIFEKNGFVVQLDLYVLEEVCKMIRDWLDRGLEVPPVSVNVSRRHFVIPHFIDGYAEVCRRHGVPPALIELEVTETVVFEDPALFTAIVEEMHAAGFTCSMDDFGSGYSSLNVLRDIEVDTLKLDRAFFSSRQMDNPRERDVVCTVVDLAQKLHMRTVAEGVETAAQQAFLEQTACDLLQGYVFSRPLPRAEYEKLVFGVPPA